MRRRTFLPATGLLAYLTGATARVHLRPANPDGLRGPDEDGAVAAARSPRAALGHPLPAVKLLAADQSE